ncbi:MAG: efflux RND transporter periplasmic adaptor subunit, partial [candidate division WOR-3 bacterium]|nr:efflux RND transporter periplasmic adaptor subunit [candidate division WOR-3 bacterium]
NFNHKKFLYENQRELYEDSLISYAEFNTSKLEYENALSALESAKSSYDIAKDQIAKTVITSPISGVVSAIYVEEGENIITGTMNNAGTVLMTVSDYGKMLVKSYVDETSVVKIKKGNKVEITFDAYPDTLFTGTVIQIAKRPGKLNQMSDEGTVYEVEILLDGNYDLLAGFNCEVSIITASKDDILQAPIQSIVNRMGREGVLTVENSTVRFIPAKPGIIGKDLIEIKSDSLEEGMKVVSGPFSSIKRLNDNDRVIDREFTGKPGLNKKQ